MVEEAKVEITTHNQPWSEQWNRRLCTNGDEVVFITYSNKAVSSSLIKTTNICAPIKAFVAWERP